ncbi:MAG TPA: DUF5666 domain-containing protein [Ktedonobacterales bacterium]|nr:DUF5666 domain-containing protein [Ktedonobacterales bacterium]
MLDKVVLLLKGKAALAVVGLLVAGGGGTAVAVAAQTHTGPFANTHASSTPSGAAHGSGSSNNIHAHTVAIEGVLHAYDAGAGTISVQEHGKTSATTISVNDQTVVNGDRAKSLADLTKNINHNVQVQADKQDDGTLLAWKVTVGGPANPNADGTPGNSGDNQGNGGQSADQRPLVGVVSSIDISTSSFVLTKTDGTNVTVTVSGTTEFQGSAHALADLKAHMHVTVKGAMQTDGTIAATSLLIGA